MFNQEVKKYEKLLPEYLEISLDQMEIGIGFLGAEEAPQDIIEKLENLNEISNTLLALNFSILGLIMKVNTPDTSDLEKLSSETQEFENGLNSMKIVIGDLKSYLNKDAEQDIVDQAKNILNN